MDWNEIGWKCKRQKKVIDLLLVICAALIITIIILHVKASDVRYTTMADMAAEAGTHTYWRDMYDYDVRQLNKTLTRLDEEYAALEAELHAILNGQ